MWIRMIGFPSDGSDLHISSDVNKQPQRHIMVHDIKTDVVIISVKLSSSK